MRFINGRYVDRLIAGDASILELPQFKAGGYIKGSRDREDVSYARPLSLEVPTERW